MEETVSELAEDISALRAQITRINAKLAVDTRVRMASNPDSKANKLLKELLGGDIVSIQDTLKSEVDKDGNPV